jgi:very-short-patch-repair endonuclease
MLEKVRSKSPLPLREGVRGRGTAPPPRKRSATVVRARELRKTATPAEQKLWQVLRRKTINGFRFRRQFPLGPYFGDFVCLPARLVIEIDGDTHTSDEARAYDERRTRWLTGQNFRVMRFWNIDVFQNLEGAVEQIEHAVREATPPPTPSRKGRGSTG